MSSPTVKVGSWPGWTSSSTTHPWSSRPTDALRTHPGSTGSMTLSGATASPPKAWPSSMSHGTGSGTTRTSCWPRSSRPGSARSGGGELQGLGQPVAQHGFGGGPRLAGQDVLALHDEHRGDALDPEALRQTGRGVDVDRRQLHRAGVAAGQLFEGRAHHPAWTAPRRPQVNEDGDRRFLDHRAEVRVVRLDDPGKGGLALRAAGHARGRGRHTGLRSTALAPY